MNLYSFISSPSVSASVPLHPCTRSLRRCLCYGVIFISAQPLLSSEGAHCFFFLLPLPNESLEIISVLKCE